MEEMTENLCPDNIKTAL